MQVVQLHGFLGQVESTSWAKTSVVRVDSFA